MNLWRLGRLRRRGMNPEKSLSLARHARLALSTRVTIFFLIQGGQERPTVITNGALRGIPARRGDRKRQRRLPSGEGFPLFRVYVFFRQKRTLTEKTNLKEIAHVEHILLKSCVDTTIFIPKPNSSLFIVIRILCAL